MSLEDTLISLRGIGLSEQEEEMVLITDEPKTPGYICFANEDAKKIFDTKDTTGQGSDVNRTKARIKAIAEFLERLSLFNPDISSLRTASFRTDRNYINPKLFSCSKSQELSDLQLENQEYRWINVTDILDGKPKLMPAQLIFLSNLFDDEVQIRKERITTGAAFGPVDSDFAFRAGLLESIERDACISLYLTRRRLKRIIDFPKDIQQIVDYLSRYYFEPLVFDATTDLDVPTALAITLDRSGIGSAINIGSASDFTYSGAVTRAILESVQCRRQGRLMEKVDFPTRTFPKENEIHSIEDRFYYWHSLERINDLDFWLDQPQLVSFSELSKGDSSLDEVLKTLRARKYNIFVADTSLPQIKNKGYQVLKVIIPELHPLYLDERAKELYSIHYGDIKDDLSLKPHPLT